MQIEEVVFRFSVPACALVFYQTPQEPEKVTMVMSIGASA